MADQQLLEKQISLALEVLRPLLEDDGITDIYVDDYNSVTVKRAGGVVEATSLSFESSKHLESAACLLARQREMELSIHSPFLDTVTSIGQRINVVISPIYEKAVCLTIRKFPTKSITAEDLLSSGTINETGLQVLRLLVAGEKRILVAGETGSGKTTLLNVLCSFISTTCGRVISIEDARELNIHHPHLIRLQTVHPGSESLSEDTRNKRYNDVLVNSLRMDPDWTILGEIRGSEALTMVESFISHPGMATIHAKDCRAALVKLKMKIAAASPIPPEIIDQMIATSVDFVVFMKKTEDQVRRVMEISEVIPLPASHAYKINQILKFDPHFKNYKITARPSFLDGSLNININSTQGETHESKN